VDKESLFLLGGCRDGKRENKRCSNMLTQQTCLSALTLERASGMSHSDVVLHNPNNGISNQTLVTSTKPERKKGTSSFLTNLCLHWVICREGKPAALIRRKNTGIKISCSLKKIHKLEHSLKNSHLPFCRGAAKGWLLTRCFTAGPPASGAALSGASPSYSIPFRTQTALVLKHNKSH